MIIFPLMTTWMWFQIITASPLPSSGRRHHLREASKSASTDLPDRMESLL
jgi:hypothetical protein